MASDEFQRNNYPNLNPIILTTAQSNNLSNLNKLKEKCKLPLKYSEKLNNKLKEKLFASNNNNKINFDYSEKSNEIITEYFYIVLFYLERF